MRGTSFEPICGYLVAVLAIVLLAFQAVPDAQAAGKRVALVVGNGAYQSVAQLPNPKKDAELVSSALRKQGFEVVTAIDLTRIELERAVERYARSLNGAEISLFYYSGHGIEVSSENRIIPVDATLNAPEDLETQTYSLQTILQLMQNNSQAQLIYMDACRDNPFSNRAYLLGADDTEKRAGKGLAEQKGAIGSLIAYATEPGKVALDGEGDNSPFTSAVIRHSFTQDADVQSALMKVTADVWEATQQSQRPWINSSLVKPVFLNDAPIKLLAADPPTMNRSLAEIQLEEKIQQVVAGPATIGAGPQSVFDEANALPDAKFYKLMQMPLSGSLSFEGQVLSEGTVMDFAKFRRLKFEPSTDTQVFKETDVDALFVPTVVVETAAIAANGSTVPVQIRIEQRMNECDVLAAEPLDVQGIGKGLELDRIDYPQALSACQRAVKEQPENARYIYLLGRAQLAADQPQIAAQTMQQAADAGYIRAFFQLGVMALNGQGVEKNLKVANSFFKQAADKGDPLGLQFYGLNLAKGTGLKADPKQGIALLKRSAELGNSAALDELGGLYLYGGALKASPKRAAGFLEASVTRSAKTASKDKRRVFSGHVNAATDLGKLYFKGDGGVRRDLRQAIKWYEMGAGLGNQGGVADLSWIFAEGTDGFRNPAKAVWYTSLALATDESRNDPELLRRLAGLPDEAKRSALRDFVNLVGPCATQTSDSIDDTLLLLSRKTWLHRQAANGDFTASSADGSFDAPDGTNPSDELKYWNLVSTENEEKAYAAYLQHFPNGIFTDIANGRLGGLLELPKIEPKLEACKVPPPVKVKKPVKKVEPVRLISDPPKVKKPKPKPKPPVVVQKPRKKPPPPVKRQKRPRVVVEEEIPVFEEEEPEIEVPRRRRLPRLPRIRIPLPQDECQQHGC